MGMYRAAATMTKCWTKKWMKGSAGGPMVMAGVSSACVVAAMPQK